MLFKLVFNWGQYRLIKNICVFASASNNLDDCYYKDSAELGRLIGINGMNIVYGGSRLGSMYVCANSVKNNGGKIIGVMPKKFSELGYANPEDCEKFLLTEGMRERKALMDEYSDAVIALAGGYGTLEEISEMIVQKQLGYNNKPVIILNTNGFYDDLVNFFNNIIQKNFAKHNSENIYYIAKTPEDAINYLKNYNPNSALAGSKF